MNKCIDCKYCNEEGLCTSNGDEECYGEAYQQGRKDAIDEFAKAFKDNMLKSIVPTWMCYFDYIAEQLKEQKND